MTNGEKIRQMSDEELADFIDEPLRLFNCDKCAKPWEERPSFGCDDCNDWIVKFMKTEAE